MAEPRDLNEITAKHENDLRATRGVHGRQKRQHASSSLSVDDVSHLLERLQSLQAERSWQPIETAPKDGGDDLPPRILLLAGGDVHVGRWARDIWHHAHLLAGSQWQREWDWHCEGLALGAIQPTHWQPCPSSALTSTPASPSTETQE